MFIISSIDNKYMPITTFNILNMFIYCSIITNMCLFLSPTKAICTVDVKWI